MPKYCDYFRKMLKENEEAFAAFTEVHIKYQLDQQNNQEEFNKLGKPVRVIVEDYERKLCGHTEKGTYAQFSSKLAEKFYGEVKAFFPMYDFIGVQVSGPALKVNVANNKISEPKKKVDKDVAEVADMDLDSFDIPKLF